MFQDFHRGELSLYRLNFAMLTLIPKIDNVDSMKFFRSTSLINCSFKIFSKLLTFRLGKVCTRLVATTQSAFIKGRYILESVVVAHQLVHSINTSHQPGMLLKLDYEKAYDRVNWCFPFEVLKSKNFGPIWISWIEQVVKGGSVGVNLNGEESSFFSPSKGLRQGDPISPLLFNLVVDVLTMMLDKGASNGMIKGLLSEFTLGI